MATLCRCDGCGAEFGAKGAEREPAITGHRSNRLGGAGMPSGEFHLCVACGKVAFAAVEQRAAELAAGRVRVDDRSRHAEVRSGPTPI